MKDKIKLFSLGSIISISLISPPGFLRLSIIEFSDFLLLIFGIYLFIDYLNNKKFIDIHEPYIQLWLALIALLAISSFVYGINLFILRILFYCLCGFLLSLFVVDISIEYLQYFLIPFALLTFTNLFTSIFELSFVDNTIGWISYFYENPTFFNRGRLAGFQGSGPNVAGGLFSILTFLFFYIYRELKSKTFLILGLINIYLIFITFSRGSYLSLFLGLLLLIYVFNKNTKNLIVTSIVVIFSFVSFLYFGDSKVLLKESDRSFLTSIATENINLFKGLGPGNYVEVIYKDYFLSINPEILEENLDIRLNKVELGITPEELRNSDANFFIGTSGVGFEILVQSKLISECSEDRLTCQHVRVKKQLLLDFISALYQTQNLEISILFNESNCFDDNNLNILRGEFYCFVEFLYSKNSNFDNSKKIPKKLLDVPCVEQRDFKCESRELAYGELAVIVEAVSISSSVVPLENYKKYCSECDFRDVQGYLKFKFEKRDGILPRSKITFYTSDDLNNWDMIGAPRTTGDIINLNSNSSFLELGGHSDGQSFGNTFLDAVINELYIVTDTENEKIIFKNENLNKDYFVFKPNESNQYNAKITFENEGIKLFAPNKYWIAVPNKFDFNGDFEIILKLSLPEIPWERQTLISNTSVFDSQIQSWKIEIDDGRLFFYWANPEGVFLLDNVLGDKSLRSGVLIQRNGQIANIKPPIVDPSYLSQLTTAHNGYLTFSVEFGLVISIMFYAIFLLFLIRIFFIIDNRNAFTFIAISMFFIQNLTNDMIYSPDMWVLLIISVAINSQSIRSLEDKKL